MKYNFVLFVFFFNDTATTEIYTLSLHDALPICGALQPKMVYNSKDSEKSWEDWPAPKDNPMGMFGMGWSLSYGRVFLRVATLMRSDEDCADYYWGESRYYYKDASGAEHRLYPNSTVEGHKKTPRARRRLVLHERRQLLSTPVSFWTEAPVRIGHFWGLAHLLSVGRRGAG